MNKSSLGIRFFVCLAEDYFSRGAGHADPSTQTAQVRSYHTNALVLLGVNACAKVGAPNPRDKVHTREAGL